MSAAYRISTARAYRRGSDGPPSALQGSRRQAARRHGAAVAILLRPLFDATADFGALARRAMTRPFVISTLSPAGRAPSAGAATGRRDAATPITLPYCPAAAITARYEASPPQACDFRDGARYNTGAKTRPAPTHAATPASQDAEPARLRAVDDIRARHTSHRHYTPAICAMAA